MLSIDSGFFFCCSYDKLSNPVVKYCVIFEAISLPMLPRCFPSLWYSSESESLHTLHVRGGMRGCLFSCSASGISRGIWQESGHWIKAEGWTGWGFGVILQGRFTPKYAKCDCNKHNLSNTAGAMLQTQACLCVRKHPISGSFGFVRLWARLESQYNIEVELK